MIPSRSTISFYHEKHNAESIKHFLDRIFDNMKKDRKDRDPRLIESELVDFIEWLKNRGQSPNTIRPYLAAIQNFLKYYNVPVAMSFVGNFPRAVPLKINHKHERTLEEIG